MTRVELSFRLLGAETSHFKEIESIYFRELESKLLNLEAGKDVK